MKIIMLLLAFAVGCTAQQPNTPPVTVCPQAVVDGSAYTPLNAPANNSTVASITGTSTTDVPSTGNWCYILQAWAIISPATVYQVSDPSNVAGPIATSSVHPTVAFTWNAQPAGYSYILSRAAAISVPAPLAPSLNQPTVSQNIDTNRPVHPITLVASTK